MGWRCCVKICRKEIGASNPGYKFPIVNLRHGEKLQEKVKLRREAWLKSVRLNECNVTQHSKVCLLYFVSGMYNDEYIFQVKLNTILCTGKASRDANDSCIFRITRE